ncbi:BPTI/Kunitz domain-containing protein, partial [Salmonella sp. s51090]|uniref:BPTI/Kunitz domain-containing protein n=1 Tax=Salmonella sp. s51090 TaxID=3159651 RepID=UPI003980BECF
MDKFFSRMLGIFVIASVVAFVGAQKPNIITGCIGKSAGNPAALNSECLLPKPAGLCKGYLRRWYYDKVSGKCKVFTYGGC